MKEIIIRRTLQLFRSCELRTITMDDVAHSLAMSKKTLYQFFKNKECFMRECVDYRIRQWGLHEQPTQNESLTELLLNYAHCFGSRDANISLSCCQYIRTNHRDVYHYLTEHLERFATQCADRVEESIRRGDIRQDTTPELIHLFLQSHFTQLFADHGPEVESHKREYMEQLVCIFVRGISTAKEEDYLKHHH